MELQVWEAGTIARRRPRILEHLDSDSKVRKHRGTLRPLLVSVGFGFEQDVLHVGDHRYHPGLAGLYSAAVQPDHATCEVHLVPVNPKQLPSANTSLVRARRQGTQVWRQLRNHFREVLVLDESLPSKGIQI